MNPINNLHAFSHALAGYGLLVWEDHLGCSYTIHLDRLQNEEGKYELVRPYAVEVTKKGKFRDGAEGLWIEKRPPLAERATSTWNSVSLNATSAKWAPVVAEVLKWAEEGDEVEKARLKAEQRDAACEEEKNAAREKDIRVALLSFAEGYPGTDAADFTIRLAGHADREQLFALCAALGRAH